MIRAIMKYWSMLACAAVMGTGCSVSEADVVGTYVNTNYNSPICCAEAPHEPDTLSLRANGMLTSGFFGNGTWEIKDGGTRISWHYVDFMGHGAGINVPIDKGWGGDIRLVLNADMNHYYLKIH